MKHMIIGGILASTMMVSAAQSEETISAVHAFPQTLIYTQSFLKFVDKVNTAGAGVGRSSPPRTGLAAANLANPPAVAL